jgi:hypothetical protein
MIVEPNLLGHIKLTRFRARLPVKLRDRALEMLLRIWAHCQEDKRGENWGKVDDNYVADVCQWPGEPEELTKPLFDLLVPGKNPWLCRDADGNLIVTGWNERNASMIANWYRGPYGRKGSRGLSRQEPAASNNPHENEAPPEAEACHREALLPSGSEATRQDKTRQDKTGGETGHAGFPADGPPPPQFAPLAPTMFRRELDALLKVAKAEWKRIEERPDLTERVLKPEVADLVSVLVAEGKHDRAEEAKRRPDAWVRRLSPAGKVHRQAWREQIERIEKALKGIA